MDRRNNNTTRLIFLNAAFEKKTIAFDKKIAARALATTLSACDLTGEAEDNEAKAPSGGGGYEYGDDEDDDGGGGNRKRQRHD